VTSCQYTNAMLSHWDLQNAVVAWVKDLRFRVERARTF
jgi:hypothetical protein